MVRADTSVLPLMMEARTTKLSARMYFSRLMTTWLLLLATGVLTIKIFPTLYWQGPLEAADFHRRFMEGVSNDSISTFLKEITKDPHVAGTHENFVTASYVHEKFESSGISAHYADYDVFLTYPLKRSLQLTFSNGSVVEFPLREKPVEGDAYSNSSKIIPTFLAYSPSGTVTGEVVYANYGQKDDFDKLRAMGINMTGSIVIARLRKSFRGNIVLNAEAEGAAAAVLYSDPFDDAANGTEGYYPDSKWLPPSGVQRGSLYLRAGDPLTPGWPSNKGAERLDVSDPAVVLPKIPALPISAEDALLIMKALGGAVAPSDWQGGFGVQYHVGKGPAKLHLSYVANQTTTGIRDVIGVIPGMEKDRYVLLGNHRDAWTFGAADPNSGTACLLEIARLLGKLLKCGWKPRRTIVLCSWDAEEYGLIGSTEWVEDNLEILSARAIAYLNVDVAVDGPGFSPSATPQLDDLLVEITKMVDDPESSSGTVYDAWCKMKSATCEMERLGGGSSDYAPFLQHAGIPAVDISYGKKFPVYHSAYDNYNWMEKFGDPLFHRHAAICTIWGLAALRLADDRILPFNYATYANVLENAVKSMEDELAQKEKADRIVNVTFTPLYSALKRLHKSAVELDNEARREVDAAQGCPFQKQRKINDQLLLAERAFLDPAGLPDGKSWFKHLVFGPSSTDVYGTESFPAIVDSISKLETSSKKTTTGSSLQHEIWRAARVVTAAANVLRGELS